MLETVEPMPLFLCTTISALAVEKTRKVYFNLRF